MQQGNTASVLGGGPDGLSVNREWWLCGKEILLQFWEVGQMD